MEDKLPSVIPHPVIFLEDLCHCCVDVCVTVRHGHTVTHQNVLKLHLSAKFILRKNHHGNPGTQ